MSDIIPCSIKQLPVKKLISAMQFAVSENPANHPPARAIMGVSSPPRLAVMVGKRWGPKVNLPVRFLDNPQGEMRRRILDHMNAWGERANIVFVETATSGTIRIARVEDGYWSYLGTDNAQIPDNHATMNLQGFSMNTPDSEFFRVVRHEAGHALGFPHEHMRRTLVDRIDKAKAIAYFMASQGWTRQDVIDQVLTPLERVKIKGSYRVDESSIMAYRIPGAITKSGRPILGGSDITATDHHFAASIYPK